MITDMIREDHAAGREIFAVAGNSTFEATDEREATIGRLARLWRAHDAMIEQAVLPVLDGVGPAAEPVRRIRGDRQRIAELAAGLARLADRSNDQDLDRDPSLWLTGFERLKAAFEELCSLEANILIPLIHDTVPPEGLAEMARLARQVREREGI